MKLFNASDKRESVIAILKAKIAIESIKHSDRYLGTALFAYEDEASNFDIINFVMPGKKTLPKHLSIGELRFNSYEMPITDLKSEHIVNSEIIYDPNQIISQAKSRYLEEEKPTFGTNQYLIDKDFIEQIVKDMPRMISFSSLDKENLAVFQLVVALYESLLNEGYDERTLFRLAFSDFFVDGSDNLLGLAYACYKKANDITGIEVNHSFQKYLK